MSWLSTALKPGLKTTEFWLGMIFGVACLFADFFTGITAKDPLAAAITIASINLSAAWVVVAYIRSRGEVKAASTTASPVSTTQGPAPKPIA